MYLENRSDRQRESWKFTYSASALFDAAKKKQRELFDAEMKARLELSAELQDPTKSANSKKSDELKLDVSNYGTQREQMDVLVHEFQRNMHREYTLSAGDVVYFGLQESSSLIYGEKGGTNSG